MTSYYLYTYQKFT